MLCKHWFEDNGEYCKARECSCACGADKKYCGDSRYFNATNKKIKAFRETDRIDRTIAALFPERS